MNKSHAGVLVLLVALSAAVQSVLIERSVVPALDSVRFVGHAQTLAREGYWDGLENVHGQPLFPWLLAVGHTTLARLGVTAPWGVTAQWTAGALVALSVAPIYGFILLTAGRRAAMAGSLVYCFLPAVARFGADALSESVTVLVLATLLLAIARYFHSRNHNAVSWAALAGLLSGLVWLARPDALLAGGCFGAMLVLCFLHTLVKRPSAARGALAAVAAFTIFVTAPIAPILWQRGATSANDIAVELLGGKPRPERAPLNATADTLARVTDNNHRSSEWRLDDGQPMAFGAKDATQSSRVSGAAAIAEFGEELARAFGLILGPAALAGMWIRRARLCWPVQRFLAFTATAMTLALAAHVVSAGYLSGRHVLLLVLLGLPWGAITVVAAGDWFAQRLPVHVPPWSMTAAACAALAVVLADPSHQSRAPHRQAAERLAAEIDAGAVLDTRGWTALFTDAPTYRYETAQAALDDPRLRFIIVEAGEMSRTSPRARTLDSILRRGGALVERYCGPGEPAEDVLVFRWSPERWAQSHHALTLVR